METGPRFNISSKTPKKQGINLAIPGLVVQLVIHYTNAAPALRVKRIEWCQFLNTNLSVSGLISKKVHRASFGIMPHLSRVAAPSAVSATLVRKLCNKNRIKLLFFFSCMKL